MDEKYFTERGMRAEGLARDVATEMHRLIAHAPLLEEFTIAEITAIGEYMPVFAADSGQVIIGEGEVGDFMIIIISGSIEVTRRDKLGRPSRIAVVQAGHALGEMSMLDGEPRFASCIALEPTRFAVLTRENLTKVIEEQSRLGAKVLVKLVHMLAQRLRNTSTRLVTYMGAERSTEAE
jgi:CRP/FNR family cyclic AMP-dependent transcriptional regulator